MAARGGSAKIATLWEGGWGAEVGGDWEAGPGAPARRRLGGAGWEEAGPGGSADPSTGEPGGPGAGRRGAARGCGDTWPRGRDAGKDAEGTGGTQGAAWSRAAGNSGPDRRLFQGRTGRLRRPEFLKAKHAHARRKVLAGRPGLSLLVPGPWAARGRAEDGEPKAPASQVRAAPCRRLHSSQTSF